MANLDFISGKDFRQSLESDHAEMKRCLDGGAFKSAQVIAGSIVEALLADHLVTVANPHRAQRDPLHMDLAEAVQTCVAEGALSKRTADLAGVMLSYRNLLHPGRELRLKESTPSQESASIAASFVELVAAELAAARRKHAGLTAEQVLGEIERNHESLAALKEWVKESKEAERERLLLELMPSAYHARCHARSKAGEASDDDVAARLASAYRAILAGGSVQLQERVASAFVRVLRQAGESYVRAYADAFFRAPQLKYVPADQRPMVVDYLLARAQPAHVSSRSLELIEGIGPFLDASRAQAWVDPLVRTVTSSDTPNEVRKAAAGQLAAALSSASADFSHAVLDRVANWKYHFDSQGAADKVALLDEFAASIPPPF